MDRRNLYAGDLQIDYFSESYSHFEEDFQRYSNMSVPLTFLIDDILRTMALCRTNYFKLNQENAKDGRNHYFVFKVGCFRKLCCYWLWLFLSNRNDCSIMKISKYGGVIYET